MLGMLTDYVIDAVRGIVKFLLVLLLWELVLFYLGCGVLLLCTWGRYPRGKALEHDTNRIAFTGLLALACAWSALTLYNNFGPGHGIATIQSGN